MTCDSDSSGPSALPTGVDGTDTPTMDNRDNATETLSRAQCLDLLRTEVIARVAYSQRAMPAIVTVDYAVVDDFIVLRLDEGAVELTSLRNAVVAFQADDRGSTNEQSWSVSCVGKVRPIEDAIGLPAIAAARDWPPADTTRPVFLRMEPELLEGRVIHRVPTSRAEHVSVAAAPAS